MSDAIPQLDPRLRKFRSRIADPDHGANTVASCMTTDVYAVLAGDTIYAAAELLLAAGVSGVPVISHEGEVAGILTLTDLLGRLGGGKLDDVGVLLQDLLGGVRSGKDDAAATRVRDIMTTPAIVATPDESLLAVGSRLMARKIHQLPVVENGCLVGMVTRSDIIAALVARAEREAGYPERSAQRHLAAQILAEPDPARD